MVRLRNGSGGQGIVRRFTKNTSVHPVAFVFEVGRLHFTPPCITCRLLFTLNGRKAHLDVICYLLVVIPSRRIRK
jgi:hypothetical protein